MTRQRRHRPDLGGIRSELKDFQLATADAVVDRMFDPANPQHRFLVADEVGLGKTKVARAVVAETVQRLWDKVKRVDVVYLCSNSQIARQNLRDLDVTGDGLEGRLADRITMLPAALAGMRDRRVNVVAFTPGTSLTVGGREGKVQERALLHALLIQAWDDPGLLRRGGAHRMLRGSRVNVDTWQRVLRQQAEIDLGPVLRPFRRELDAGLRAEFEEIADGRRWRSPSRDLQRQARQLVGRLRLALARACVGLLTPDLVILDEFQRFPHLLDAGEDDDEATLAQLLFDQPDVRVLLLSATPYRMYSRRERDHEDHFADFARTTRFLLGADAARADGLISNLQAVRRGLDRGADVAELVPRQREVEQLLRQLMVRTERLASTADREGMLQRVPTPPAPVTAADVRAFLTVDAVARELNAPGVVEYWKSAPFLLNFMEGYQLGQRLDREVRRAGPIRARLARATDLLDPTAISEYAEVDPHNGRLRWLVDDLTTHHAWDLAWLPPSLPQTTLRGTYASEPARRFTKRLIFSGWTVVPKALACLLSYEAERRRHRGPHRYHDPRRSADGLTFRRDSGSLSSFPLLALLWPGPGLARLGDPLRYTRERGVPLPVDIERLGTDVRRHVQDRLRPLLAGAPRAGREDLRWYAVAAAALDDPREPVLSPGGGQPWVLSHDQTQQPGVLEAHVDALLELSPEDLGRPPGDLADVLATVAVAGPGPVARRGLDRVCARFGWDIAASEAVSAAARLAWTLRSVLTTPEIAAIVGAGADQDGYWRQVLRHCQDGGLGSVVDEYLHLLPEQERVQYLPCSAALDRLVEAAQAALRVPSTQLQVDTFSANTRAGSMTRERFGMRPHFAVRFGQVRGADESEHPSRVRAAFNSPFWPFVLVSTSIGQEGLDFHHYAHAVVHWNLPSNPVDLEQREGRVHRYKNHAVRKNVAAAFGGHPEVSAAYDPWEAVFALAERDRPAGSSDIVPWWVYPRENGASIERHVPLLPMSRDVGRLQELVDGARLYRMTFGQARQSELLASLAERYDADQLARIAAELSIDLSPAIRQVSPGSAEPRVRPPPS